MSRSELPVWLVEELPVARRSLAAARHGAVQGGDLCRLSVPATQGQGAEGRLVLVLDVDPDLGLASVMLAHVDYDIRTDLDVLLTGAEIELPFDLALQTDLVGPIHVSSLVGTALGHVPEPLLEGLRDAVETGQLPASLVDRTGIPLRGQADARWEWKIAEGEILDRLLAAYAYAGAESESHVQALAEAFRAIGRCSDREDDLGTVTDCLFAYLARSETPPTPVLTLLAQPPTAAVLGRDMMRALGPLLRVA